MLANLFIDTASELASTVSNEHTEPALRARLGSPLQVSLGFHSGGTVAPLSGSAHGKVTVQKANATGGSQYRIGSTANWTTSGTGTSARYLLDIPSVISTQLVTDFTAGSIVAADYRLQIEWYLDAEPDRVFRTQLIPLVLDPALALPSTTLPNPLAELSNPDTYVRNRALTYDAPQTLSTEQKANVFESLGMLDPFSYQPYTIAVAAQQQPGVETVTTLQEAIDAVAAAPSNYRTIRIVEITGLGLEATAPAFTISTLRILGAGEYIASLDLSAAAVAILVTDCKYGDLIIADEASAAANPILELLSNAEINTLTARGVRKNLGSGSSPVFNSLTIRGQGLVAAADFSGADGQAVNGQRNACNGRNLDTVGSVYIGGFDASGGDGAIGDVGDASGNGGHGGWPGTYTAGALSCVEFASGTLSTGGTGGAGAGGSGVTGDDHTGDSSSGTAHDSATVIP